jgi:hypothetical protein
MTSTAIITETADQPLALHEYPITIFKMKVFRKNEQFMNPAIPPFPNERRFLLWRTHATLTYTYAVGKEARILWLNERGPWLWEQYVACYSYFYVINETKEYFQECRLLRCYAVWLS